MTSGGVLASRAFTAFGRTELAEWATADRLVGYADFFLLYREERGRYPSTVERGT